MARVRAIAVLFIFTALLLAGCVVAPTEGTPGPDRPAEPGAPTTAAEPTARK